jgi:hypothetical protein
MFIQAVEDLCMHKFGGSVYDKLSLECESHITKQVDRYIYIHIHKYIYVYVHIHIYIYIFTYVYIFVYTYLYKSSLECESHKTKQVDRYKQLQFSHTCIYMFVYSVFAINHL